MLTRVARRAVALIDYDNARPDPEAAERNSGDVSTGVLSVSESLVAALSNGSTIYGEVRLRFYGGWVHEDGRWTERADWMREELRALRGLRNGIRLLPELAVALMSIPARDIRGTARVRTDRSGFSLRQKMVDTMLSTDLVLLRPAPDEDVIVVSDDDDIVPALMIAQSQHGRVRVLRRRVAGRSCNDNHLVDLGTSIELLRP